MVDICDNISALIQASMHPESVTLRWKQAGLISYFCGVYHSIDSNMPLVCVYGHHNSRSLALTLASLSSLNVQLEPLSKYIMASFLRLPAPRTSLAVGFSYLYGLPSLSIRGVPVHSNLAQSTVYDISKHRLLQYLFDQKLTHMEDWEEIYLSPFEQAWDRTTAHMSHFITKFMRNSLSTMTIIQEQDHASTNLCS